MGNQARLKDLISWAVEAYELAAHPPTQDPARKIEPTTAQSRPSALHIGIDVKYIVHHQLTALPLQQATNIIEYLQDPTALFKHTLTDYFKNKLDSDIYSIKQALFQQGYK